MTAEPDPVEKDDPPRSIPEDQFLRRHFVFIRRARDISHQALFFLGLLYDTTSDKAKEAVQDYQPFALDQVRSLYRSAHPPEETPKVENKEAEVERAVTLHRLWEELGGKLKDGDAKKLRQALQEFLDRSRSGGMISSVFVHLLPDIYTYFRKNLALLWGVLILLGVTLKVEAVNSLLLNEFKHNAAGLVLPLMVLLVPLFVSRVWTLVLRLNDKAPFWDISSSAFRSFRHQALEPGRLIDRWPRHTGLRREIVRGQAVKLLAYALWWVLAFAFFYYLHMTSSLGTSGSTLTVFMVLSLCYAVLLVAHIVDLWEYLDPQPVRFLMLLAFLGALGALLLGVGREYFLTAFLLGAAKARYD